MLETYALKKLNAFRKALGLRPIVWKTTQCLTCKKVFDSYDYPRQRLCRRCRKETDDLVSFSIPGAWE